MNILCSLSSAYVHSPEVTLCGLLDVKIQLLTVRQNHTQSNRHFSPRPDSADRECGGGFRTKKTQKTERGEEGKQLRCTIARREEHDGKEVRGQVVFNTHGSWKLRLPVDHFVMGT